MKPRLEEKHQKLMRREAAGASGKKSFTVGVAGIAIPGADESASSTHDVERLMEKYGTDQGMRLHQYCKLYDVLFAPRRSDTRLVMEIGVGTQDLMGYPPGASLRVWRDYFPQSQIVGVDIDPAAAINGESRIHVATPVDTTQPAGVEKTRQYLQAYVAQDKVDILIDDGAHDPPLQGQTMEGMFELVKDGGLYIIEDMPSRQGVPDGKQQSVHRFCDMTMSDPFGFGSGAARDAAHGTAVKANTRHYTSPRISEIFRTHGAFYASTSPGWNSPDSNLLVIQKNKTGNVFPPLVSKYNVVYDAFLKSDGGSFVQSVVIGRGIDLQVWKEAFPSAEVQLAENASGIVLSGVDVLVTSTSDDSAKQDQVLKHFANLRNGGILLVEDVRFSFCGPDGSPTPDAFQGQVSSGLIQIMKDNPRFFVAMTDDDQSLKKLLIIRK